MSRSSPKSGLPIEEQEVVAIRVVIVVVRKLVAAVLRPDREADRAPRKLAELPRHEALDRQ